MVMTLKDSMKGCLHVQSQPPCTVGRACESPAKTGYLKSQTRMVNSQAKRAEMGQWTGGGAVGGVLQPGSRNLEKLVHFTLDLGALRCEGLTAVHCRARGPTCTNIILNMNAGNNGKEGDEAPQMWDSHRRHTSEGHSPPFPLTQTPGNRL
ncbi:hypothetical protein AAFF_G00332750 [Aldrovandia affinis]|uniref:Uncharacterized protein n=1 Tax=Aldrovandia affinis TaxID=143900 RepID=A0AAD7SLV4_9TELE|nr:hypothetical protein AAFF_G00332750 [Aldrovandia affinis]